MAPSKFSILYFYVAFVVEVLCIVNPVTMKGQTEFFASNSMDGKTLKIKCQR